MRLPSRSAISKLHTRCGDRSLQRRLSHNPHDGYHDQHGPGNDQHPSHHDHAPDNDSGNTMGDVEMIVGHTGHQKLSGPVGGATFDELLWTYDSGLK